MAKPDKHEMNQELYLRLLADYIYQGYQLDIARMLAADAAQAQVEHQKDKDDERAGDWTA